ncbi:MAG: prolyl oligopeptidase family serine peptidase [Planctomycetaceae bacterium]|nr:prolyl oligopeptidase family serine peptidase [Planctomycetaceae bacterium]
MLQVPMVHRSLLLSIALLFCVPTVAMAQQMGVWNIDDLRQTPQMKWLDQSGKVQSLLYSGEPYNGHSTEVFAFYASPATLSDRDPSAGSDEKFPAVVLIHGGGGTAFAEWAWLWAQRGYAAIAMDLSGHRPPAPVYDPTTGAPVLNQAAKREGRIRLDPGGPDQGHDEKFRSISGDRSSQWPYHAVANVVKAHSLIRSFSDVDADRTAVTGISWGGYTTCLVASVDDRFKAAVPVYGCGFLFEGESVQKPAIDQLGEYRAEWIATYDPSSHLSRCRVPILFVNGTNDVHYPLDSYQKSFNLVTGARQMRIEVNMRHGHPPGWAPKEIGLFIDSYCRRETSSTDEADGSIGQPLPVPDAPRQDGDHIVVNVQTAVPLKSAALHYTTDSGRRSDRKWTTVPAEISQSVVRAMMPPDNANTWFVSVTDQRDAMVTTSVQFAEPDLNN